MAADKKQEAKTSGVSNIAASGASKVATKVATQGAIRAGFTAASTAIGNVAGLAASQAAIWATKHRKEAAALLAAPLTLPLAAIGAFFGLLVAGVAGVAAAVGASLVIAIIAVPVLIAFFMFIINSGAYIVPPGDIFIPGTSTNVGCYQFDASWNAVPERRSRIAAATGHILARPGALEKICSGGPITLTYLATGLAAGGRTRGNTIEISPIGSEFDTAALYTLAHESGHIVDNRNSFVEALYRSIGPRTIDSGRPPHPQCDSDGDLSYLPSYGCFDTNDPDNLPQRVLPKSSLEDKVESLGLWLMLPTEHSVIQYFGNFQTSFHGHHLFAQSVFSN